jgi:hypothetical protein
VDGQTAQLTLQLQAGRKARYGVRLVGNPVQVAQLGPRLLGGAQP